MAGATPQPTRVTRSRGNTPQPLPALQSRMSHAYGAQGKASLHQQVRTSATDFSDAFQNTRVTRASTKASSREPTPAKRGRKAATIPEDPIEEEDPEDLEPPTFSARQPTSARRGRKSSKQTIVPEDREDPEPTSNRINGTTTINGFGDDTSRQIRPGTGIQESAAYISTPPAQKTQTAPSMPPPAPPARPGSDENAAYEPRSSTGIITKVMLLLAFLLGLAALVYGAVYAGARVSLPASLEPYRVAALHRLAHTMNLPGLNVSTTQPFINSELFDSINQNERATARLHQRIEVQQATLGQLEEILPRTLVAKEENGKWVIPTLFWKALEQKMSSQEDSSLLWENFLRANEGQLQAIIRASADESFDSWAASRQLISREDLLAAIAETSRTNQEHLDETLSQFRQEMTDISKKTAEEVISRSSVMALANKYIHAISQSVLIDSLYQTLQHVNYFAPGLNAMVNPRLTSDTKLPAARTWIQWAWSNSGAARAYPNSASVALRSWEDATDCWCAAPSSDERGLAQIGVKLGWKIYPEQLVIEHIPAKATRDIKSAPKDFEIWAQVDNAKDAKRIQSRIGWFNVDNACKGTPPRGEKNWVCLNAETYDIHKFNYMQTFPMIIDAESNGIETQNIVVRALSNWGSDDHTCFYRLRFTGKEVGAPKEE